MLSRKTMEMEMAGAVKNLLDVVVVRMIVWGRWGEGQPGHSHRRGEWLCRMCK